MTSGWSSNFVVFLTDLCVLDFPHGRLMFKIQFGRNSKLGDIGTAMSNKIIVLLLMFLKELKSLRSCTSCSYNWCRTTHLILTVLAENSLEAFTYLAALVKRTCHLHFHPLFAASREKHLKYFHFISDEKAAGVRMGEKHLV
ncbi:hypothetical protein KY290_005346 [Solanum tuberosum]|uniref:Uncharacterized protein n=1 Tax=Solanum tuberosum TaxID=4113 RepID=A0ABQ7WFR6_SOLTU|nr:hypothetical protein KY289_005735 [Solanum tuberosum]KAH0778919.1 hypothetical protein KY290_005346 [Solanum tuberosum]